MFIKRNLEPRGTKAFEVLIFLRSIFHIYQRCSILCNFILFCLNLFLFPSFFSFPLLDFLHYFSFSFSPLFSIAWLSFRLTRNSLFFFLGSKMWIRSSLPFYYFTSHLSHFFTASTLVEIRFFFHSRNSFCK